MGVELIAVVVVVVLEDGLHPTAVVVFSNTCTMVNVKGEVRTRKRHNPVCAQEQQEGDLRVSPRGCDSSYEYSISW